MRYNCLLANRLNGCCAWVWNVWCKWNNENSIFFVGEIYELCVFLRCISPDYYHYFQQTLSNAAANEKNCLHKMKYVYNHNEHAIYFFVAVQSFTAKVSMALLGSGFTRILKKNTHLQTCLGFGFVRPIFLFFVCISNTAHDIHTYHASCRYRGAHTHCINMHFIHEWNICYVRMFCLAVVLVSCNLFDMLIASTPHHFH